VSNSTIVGLCALNEITYIKQERTGNGMDNISDLVLYAISITAVTNWLMKKACHCHCFKIKACLWCPSWFHVHS